MAEFIKHIPCPECGSKDNRGVWDDGHEYCFGCHDYTRGTGIKRIEHLANKKKNRSSVILPDDVVFNIPEIAQIWLNKYGITTAEVYYHKFVWSENGRMLIMPIYNIVGELKAWQGRIFDSPEKKYHTEGNIEDIDYILGKENSNRIVIVEDMLSAIKVSRIARVLPLFGSNISTARLSRLSDEFTHIVVWLDRDKARYATSTYHTVKLVFSSVRMVLKEKDPKEYTDDQIQKALMGA